MRSFVTCAVLVSIASAAAAQLGHPLFEYPDTVPLDKRQEPGTPRYQCHEDCGVLISLGRQDGYCETAEWTERYGRCMSCALEYDIWKYYSGSVTTAATKCGLDPTPSPSGAAAATTAAPATSLAAPAPTTTAVVDVTATTTGTSTAALPTGDSSSSSAAVAASSSSAAGGVPATTLSTQAGGAASDSATAPTGSSTGASAAAAAAAHSIGTCIAMVCAAWAWYLM
ncbi:hypothetical protein CGRA01v4_08932 [Colletotrichum graminicola]|uniref:Uncharacterized protein n=1 Tax=Colletotrichum graminicola (strain M1.001 / M2 / FGSC 10212) TaxID=645133 RepID=E3Q7G0_COLGM|nr:uncharacterized protein GLRG_02618 [Colletotrichum graminicola M1.001]EFQ26798.1 hypothetical protein GLRG_02618 [Colletotrichum graminicola M1.001]WDK17649.1 hypothetical protein CGRA01v4_08932 [Colletotrichum graminicola]